MRRQPEDHVAVALAGASHEPQSVERASSSKSPARPFHWPWARRRPCRAAAWPQWPRAPSRCTNLQNASPKATLRRLTCTLLSPGAS
jgi:hypothetical protein